MTPLGKKYFNDIQKRSPCRQGKNRWVGDGWWWYPFAAKAIFYFDLSYKDFFMKHGSIIMTKFECLPDVKYPSHSNQILYSLI